MKDSLIDDLVADLQPVNPLRWRRLGVLGIMFWVVGVVAVIVAMGIRRDYVDAYASGALFWKPALFIILSYGCGLLLLEYSRPNGRWKWLHVTPIVAGLGILVWRYGVWLNQPDADPLSIHSVQLAVMGSDNISSAMVCFTTIIVLGAMIFGVTWWAWLRQTATPNASRLGAFAGFAAGAIAASAYAFHCRFDAPLYISLYYFAPMCVLGVLGGWLGKRYLAW